MDRASVRQLEYLVAAVEYGSFTMAASRLHVTQAAVSTGIAQLQRTLGVKLFIPLAGHGVVPTPAARRIVDQAADVLRRVDDLVWQSDRHGEEEIYGTVKLGFSETFSSQLMPALIHRLQTKYPLVEPLCTEASPLELASLHASQRCDLSFLYDRQLTTRNARAISLAEIHPHVVIAKDHPVAQGAEISLNDLLELPLATLEVEPTNHRQISLVLSVTGEMPAVKWSSPLQESVYAVVARGLAFTISYISPASAQSSEGLDLRYIPISDEVTPNRLIALESPGERSSVNQAVMREMVVLLREKMTSGNAGFFATNFNEALHPTSTDETTRKARTRATQDAGT